MKMLNIINFGNFETIIISIEIILEGRKGTQISVKLLQFPSYLGIIIKIKYKQVAIDKRGFEKSMFNTPFRGDIEDEKSYSI